MRLHFKHLILALAAFVSIGIANAQGPATPPEKKPASFPLTETERQQWAQFGAAEQQLQKRLTDVVNQAIQIPVEAQRSMEFHAAIKDVLQQSQIVSARKDAWLGEQRAGKSCRGCVVEGDALVDRGKQ